MKKKFLGRLLTMLLVAAMVFTLLPASAIAADWWGSADEYADDVSTQAATDDYKYNIFFLDCGRKYYSVDSIKQFIDNASAAGFNYIQLAVGNDGLRFLLDDMSLTVNGKTYESNNVKAAIHSGNEEYYNFDVDELTQSEMDTIISYAASKSMGVIPCINTPGHMDAILSAATSLTETNCSYNRSVRTIDVTNTTAVAFTQALLQKYIDYFAGKGCQLFNMGADEYANDIYTGGSMGFGNLQSSGKYSYYVTYVNTVAGMIKAAGMTPMAFNDGIYFNNKTDSGTFDTNILVCYWSNGWNGYTPMPASDLASKGFKLINTNGSYYWVLGKTDAQCSADKARGFNTTSFPGGTISNPAGSMFCVWADYPGAETEASVISKTADTVAAFGGVLPKLAAQPTVTITAKDNNTKLDLTNPNTGLTLTASEEVTWTAEPEGIVNLMFPANEEGNPSRTVEVFPVAAGTVTITATNSAGEKNTITLTVTDPSAAKNNKTINLTVGGSETEKVDGANYSDSVNSKELNTSIATVEVTGEDASKTDPIYDADYVSMATLANRNTSWTKTAYFYEVDGSYYPVYAYYERNWGYHYFYGYSMSDSSSNVIPIGSYLSSTDYITVYKKTSDGTDTPASTTITFFAGVAPGTTYVTVGDTKYTIIVDYKQETVNVVLDQTKTVSVEGTLDTSGLDTSIAEVTVSGTNMTVTGKNVGDTSVIVGNTKYTIQVREEDLTAVTPLTIEYWITNGRVLYPDKDGTNERSIAATTAGVATADGVYITADGLISAHGYREGRTVDYWHSRLLDTTLENNSTSGTEKQTGDAGDDETASGVSFTKIRYYEGSWEVFTQNNQWVKVESKHQLIAYYAEHIKVTDEVDSHASDWGKRGDGTQSGDYLNSSAVNTISVQVVYEDGITNPASTSAADLKSKTICYGYWTAGRGIGTLIFDETAEYQIYKVTAETGEMSGSGETWGSYTVNSFTWDKNEQTVWDEQTNGASNGQVVLHNNAKNPETTGIYENLHWDENKEAILIRVYVRAPLTEDTLNVHYIDMTNGSENEFYQYSINVFEGTVFDPDFGRTNAGTLVGNTVVNTNNITQTVQWDLSQMPRISAAYRHAAYNFYNATRSTDGKDVYLYYTFSRTASFIADFGLPITISLAQINDTLGSANVTGIKVETQKYGDVTTDVSAKTITYTPTKTFGEDIESLQVTVSGEITVTDENGTSTNKGDVTYTVYIIPASNVLYEENFLTQGDGWTNGTTSAPADAQQTQKVGETGKYVFGYDDAYKNATGELGVWKATGLEAGNGMTGALTTKFYGNGFDLIGNCGPDTGRVVMLLKNTDDGKGRLVDVDTRYSSETIYQVPLAHVELAQAHYTATIYAGGLTATTASTQSSSGWNAVYSSNFAVSSYDADLNSILAENGLTMADVEYTKISSVPAASSSRIATYATNSTTVAHAEGTHVEIDSFRVYRSSDNANYPVAEQGISYVNVLNNVVNDGMFTAFVEGNGTWTTVDDYEVNGGPQNEIYLRSGSNEDATSDAVAFKVTPGSIVQISARAVESDKSATLVVNGTSVEIKANTEMYYEVTASDDGIVTIKNGGSGMLALGNLKVKSGTSISSLSEEDYSVAVKLLSMSSLPVDPEPEQPTVFVPEHFSIRDYATRFFRSKLVTLRIDFSKDVSYVEIDGRKYTPNKLASWFGYYTVTFTDTIGRNDDYFYKVVFFDANGNPSETQIVYGK